MDALPKPKLDRDRSIAWDFILENGDMAMIIRMGNGEDPFKLLHDEFHRNGQTWYNSLRSYLRGWAKSYGQDVKLLITHNLPEEHPYKAKP